MPNDYRVSASRKVKASPSEVFSIITDPNMHVKIDGSGMLVAAPDSRRLEAAGDTFEMNMDREPLGDIPLGKYKVMNTVTRIIPNTLLEWNVGTAERGVIGHLYGWEIKSLDNGETEITNYCDWKGMPEAAYGRFPIVPVTMMEKSVQNLAALMNHESE